MSNEKMLTSTRRKHPRHDLYGSIQVFDRMTGENMGVLANISLDGLMIVGHAMEINCLYQLELRFSESISGKNSVNIGVDCLWNNHKEGKDIKDEGVVWSGCNIIDYPQDEADFLQHIIDRYAV